MKASHKKIIPYVAVVILLILIVVALTSRKSFQEHEAERLNLCHEEPPCETKSCDPGCVDVCDPSMIVIPGPDANTPVVENVHCWKGGNLAPHLICGGVSLSLDFLYWKANEDGLEYGDKMVAGPIIGHASKNDTHLLDMHFHWDPGFRLGLGYLFDRYDHWQVDLNWTHIRNTAYGQAFAGGIESQTGPVNTIVPPWVSLGFVLSAGASQANAKWHVDLNILDLDLGRSFFVSKRLVLNPHIGLRGAWVNQGYQAKYHMFFLLMEGEPEPPRNVHFFARNDFRSFGIRGGSEILWHFNSHWNLFAQLSGSLLYGKFNIKMKNANDQGLGEGSTPPMPIDFTASEKFWRTRLNLEEAIGISWETFFQNRWIYHLSVKAAYEMSQWFNQNELYYTHYFRGQDTIYNIPVRNHGDLGFQGIKAGIELDF